jgi:hypothetical protein
MNSQKPLQATIKPDLTQLTVPAGGWVCVCVCVGGGSCHCDLGTSTATVTVQHGRKVMRTSKTAAGGRAAQAP